MKRVLQSLSGAMPAGTGVSSADIVAAESEIEQLTDYDFILRAKVCKQGAETDSIQPLVIVYVERDCVCAVPGKYPIVFYTSCQNQIKSTVHVK